MSRLLLVDDEPRNLLALEALLAPLGHVLMRAESGRAALEVLERTAVDLVLLDMRMPHLDGIDVLRRLRASEEHSHLPVILVTAEADREARVRGLEAGADEFLEKPIDEALLLARVRTLLRLKDMNDALLARNAALERLQREQRELTAFIVHDLKSPLTVVDTNVAFVLEELSGGQPVLVEALEDAAEATGRLRSMVEDLLRVTQLEQSDVPLRREPVAVESLLDEVAQSLGRQAEARQVTLRVEPGARAEVRGDGALLRRVLENLADNALRHTPTGGQVLLSARAEGPVELAVSNTGQPIPLEQRALVFEKFRQGGVPTGRGNIGLGLYFCRRVVEAHGGDIQVLETPQWPTSVVVRLPPE